MSNNYSNCSDESLKSEKSLLQRYKENANAALGKLSTARSHLATIRTEVTTCHTQLENNIFAIKENDICMSMEIGDLDSLSNQYDLIESELKHLIKNLDSSITAIDNELTRRANAVPTPAPGPTPPPYQN